ncbi:hypothetical protein IKP85_05285 [bacterium]|nr:hypothetical protein [bacterium]
MTEQQLQAENINSENNSDNQPIIITSKELNFFEKLSCFYWLNKKTILQEFKFHKNYLSITCCSGAHFEGDLNELEILIYKPGNEIRIKKSKKQIFRFQIEDVYITKEEQQQIIELLNPRETILSKICGIWNFLNNLAG